MSPRAYDLIGDITAPAEVFPRLEALASMVDVLRDRGFHDAADETAELLEESRDFAAAMQARSQRLRRLWKAVEMASGPVTDTVAATRNVTAAALDYRAVRGKGARRS
jgi:ABC-type transporter Mla subunit MlaD